MSASTLKYDKLNIKYGDFVSIPFEINKGDFKMNKNKAKTDVNIITKQVIINTKYSSHLMPITADEKIIDEIQKEFNIAEELKAKVKRYFELETMPLDKWVKYHEMTFDEVGVFILEKLKLGKELKEWSDEK